MKEINIELFNDGSISCDNLIIGKTLENEATRLNIKLTDELSDKDFFLEFQKPEGEKLTTYKIDIVDNQVIYDIPNSLLNEQGNLLLEIVLRKDEQVWKSFNLDFTILESINASDEVPEKFPDFVTEANKILSHIELDGDGKSFLANDGTYKKSGTGGTSDYEDLDNKPSINDVILTGNKTLNELNIQPKGDYALKSDIPENLVSDKDYVHTDNNYTTTEKEKLESLNNYDDTEIKQEINQNKADIKGINDNLVNYSLITETGSKIDLNIDTTTYIMTLKLLDKNDNELSSGKVDLPIESMIINVTYENKILTFTLQNGQTIDVPLNDLISGLVTQETFDEALAKKADKTEIPTKVSQLDNDSGYLTNFTETDPTVPDFVKTITEEDIAKWNSTGDNQEIYYITSSDIIELDTLEIGVYILLNNLTTQKVKVTDSRTQQIVVPFSYIVLFKKYNDASIGENFAYFYGTDGYRDTGFKKVWLEKTSSTESLSNNRYFQIVKSTMNFAYLTSSNYFQGDVHHMAFTKCYKNLTMDNSIIICSEAPTTDDHLTNKKYVDKTQYEKMAGWNSEKTQILKNINGTLTWVDEV